MSASTNFIIKFIDSISQKYLGSRFRYEFIESSGTHIVEVVPSDLVLKDVDFADEQFSFVNDFLMKFPGENICFVTENDLVKIENPSYQTITQSGVFQQSDFLNFLLNEFDVIIPNKIKYKSIIDSCINDPKISEQLNGTIQTILKAYKNMPKERLQVAESSPNQTNETIAGFESSTLNAGESSYAMAA